MTSDVVTYTFAVKFISKFPISFPARSHRVISQAGASAFYKSVFGWEAMEVMKQPYSYNMFMIGEKKDMGAGAGQS